MSKVIVDLSDPTTFVVSKCNGKCYTRITHTHLKKYNLTIDSYCKKYNLTRQDIVCKALRHKLAWTMERSIEEYGKEDGLRRWRSYCDKQSKTNTFEYKRDKYGMTKEEFDKYNQSRFNTKDNFIQRHGEEKGLVLWEEYCNKQAYAGSSVQYFIDQYGEERGREVWEDVCRRKSNTLEVFIERYGKVEGTKRHQSMIDNKVCFFSKVSQELFREIQSGEEGEYFATKGKEYSVYCEITKSIYFYDFVNTRLKKCIEFHGDCFHANPRKYKAHDTPNPFVKTLTSKDIWDVDLKKQQCIIRERGFDFLVVWESDFYSDPARVIEKCKKFLYG
jgi:hypothetical protein